MIKITVNNSYSKIEGVDKELVKGLDNILSVKTTTFGFKYIHIDEVSSLIQEKGGVYFRDSLGRQCLVKSSTGIPFKTINDVKQSLLRRQVARIQGHILQKKKLLSPKNEFATGLLPYVHKFLHKDGLFYGETDLRKVPAPTPGMFEFKDDVQQRMPPRPDQLEVLNCLENNSRGIISAPTGSGKSYIMALMIHKFQVRTLVVVPTLQLKRQLINVFKDLFRNTDNIIVENIDSAGLKKILPVDMLICDESHHTGANTHRHLNKHAWTHIYYRYGLTATAFRSKSEESILMEIITGPVIYKMTIQEAVRKKIICPIEFYSYRVHADVNKIRLKFPNDYREMYKKYIVDNKNFNSQVCDIILNLKEACNSTLILVKEIAHGETLAQETHVPFAHADNPEARDLIERFSNGEIRTLIATVGICGEGVDTRAAEYIILAGGSGRAKVSFMQAVGRGVRKYPGKESCKVILFMDERHKYLFNHFKECRKYVHKEYGEFVTCLNPRWLEK